MKDEDKTKEQLVEELKSMRQHLGIYNKLEVLRREEEGKLQRANLFLRNILESSSSISIISTDLDHNILYWNKGAEKIFGYKPEEVVGKNKIDILYPKDKTQKEIEKIRDNIFHNRGNINCEIREVAKNGKKVWVNMNLTPRFDEKGAVAGILGIGEDITERKRAEKGLKKSLQKLRKSLDGIIHVIELTVDSRDPYTAGHQRRVSNLAISIAKKMGLSEDQIDGIRMAGIVHDLGKISVPAEILIKPGRLSEIQFEMIKTHPQVGYDILKDIDFPWPLARIVLEHHERIDGSGYPSGIQGDDLLLESKILAVADVVEAVASHRPYRASLGTEEALKEISGKKGVIYDDKVVEACQKVFNNGGIQNQLEEVI
ncbi:HD domain-containing phosphohydrolase [Fibrobacterota bacterium]